MGRIEILPAPVVDQIAAGEVVERPASVVKELVENALDAGATTIHVELENGGRSVVRVSDDGRGMDREDAVLSIDRHATSKIRTAPDLVGVATYGFRGEALGSIASVSQFELETASGGNGDTSPVGTLLRVRGGRLESVEEVARTPGTTVTVCKLFGNTPARRKFLRSAQSETRAAVEALNVLALARLDVAFKLVSQGRTLLDAPRVASVADRVAALFGRRVADELVVVEFSDGAISVRGFVQRPADARASGRKAYLFVNGRPFRDPFIIRAAEAGYRGAIAPGLRPTLFLGIGVPGERVDVNVHPAKLEVRFRDKRAVEEAVEAAVRQGIAPLGAAGAVRGTESTLSEPASAMPYRTGVQQERGRGDAALAAASLFDAAATTTEPALARSGTLLQVFDTYAADARPLPGGAGGGRSVRGAAAPRGFRGGAVRGALGGATRGAESAPALRRPALLRGAGHRSGARPVGRAGQPVGTVRRDLRLPRRHQGGTAAGARGDARPDPPAVCL